MDKISFRTKYNISMDAKPEKRRCVYCASNFKTITGRLCCLKCLKLSNYEKDKKFDELVERKRKELV